METKDYNKLTEELIKVFKSKEYRAAKNGEIAVAGSEKEQCMKLFDMICKTRNAFCIVTKNSPFWTTLNEDAGENNIIHIKSIGHEIKSIHPFVRVTDTEVIIKFMYVEYEQINNTEYEEYEEEFLYPYFLSQTVEENIVRILNNKKILLEAMKDRISLEIEECDDVLKQYEKEEDVLDNNELF